MDIFKALKENKVPVCLMDKQLCGAMLCMDVKEFDCLQSTSRIDDPDWSRMDHVSEWPLGEKYNNDYHTYRLRPDYTEDEGAPLKFKVFDDEEALGFDGGEGIQGVNLSECVNHPDFIGYLYENGWITSTPRLYVADGKGYPSVGTIRLTIEPETLKTYTVLTPTHVLFRGKK